MANIIRRHPLAQALTDFEKEFNQLFRSPADLSNIETSDWLPAIDIKEEDKSFVVKADLPGIESKNIDISIDNNVLTIKGERESEYKEKREGFVRYEREKGSFFRRISLPDSVDAEKIAAKYNNGVLEISIPKQKQRMSKKIEIKDK